MEHSYFKDRISAFIDGELPPYEEQVVGEHLVDCEECQQLKAELEKLDSLVKERSGLNEDEYWEKSAQEIENKLGLSDTNVVDVNAKKKSGYKGLGWKMVTAAASIAILTFIGINKDDIFKDIDTTPKMQAPSIALPPPESLQQDDLVLGEDNAIESATIDEENIGKAESLGKGPGTETRGKKGSTEQKEIVTPKIGIPAPSPLSESDLKQNKAQEESTVNTEPVKTIEDLLSQVEGVVTNTQGEVFIRGGRAGEVDYIVDGVPTDDHDSSVKKSKTSKTSEPRVKEEQDESFDIASPDITMDMEVEKSAKSPTVVNVELEPKTTDIDKVINVTGKQDQLKVYETANQTTITREDVATSSETSTEDSVLILKELITRRDSIETAWKKLSSGKKKLRLNSAVEKFNSIDVVEKQLLLSYYDVAIAAKNKDEEEYESAIEFLKDYAKNSRSRFPVVARNYLKRLDIIDY